MYEYTPFIVIAMLITMLALILGVCAYEIALDAESRNLCTVEGGTWSSDGGTCNYYCGEK